MTHVVASQSSFASRFHGWRENRSLTAMLLLAVAWACLMGLLAQVRLPLPFTPVPLTMQVFGVLLGGVILGARHGALAQVLYVGAGILGVSWFQGGNGGWAYVLGPTGGYLFAHPFAALLAGHLVAKLPARPALRAAGAMAAGVLTIYLFGWLWLAWVLDVSLARAAVLGVAPFVAVDALKAAAAAMLARPFVKAE